ncbi:hypothetical protein LCI18_003084 [Fusarium solani-melongenae]|uniref:Uncharacterized protein n=1 Tax=Fusarium solani subsp. cucurbitae TaxID=2747967 RepID=A0ACD3YT35_FUSSC|nr:hypothetical protein LCI18_003084 [Fusarium solani-melongenae]
MSGKSIQEEEADAALVNKFRGELDDPKSSLLKKLTSSELTAGGTAERDAATAGILKEHGYENLSPSKLSELVNPRPKDVSQIQPPGQLVAPNDPTKPVLAFSHFAGQYKITSPYHPEGAYKMIVQADPADKTKGIILWGQDSTHQRYEAKLMCSLKQPGSKETSEYWAVWGDAEGEHWKVQFFGTSETSSLASFMGFRHTKQREDTKDDAVDAFHGSMTLLQGSSGGFGILPIIVLSFIASEIAASVFVCIRRMYRRRNDPAVAEPPAGPPGEAPLDEQRERENFEREMQERERQERERQETQEREMMRKSLQDVVDRSKSEMIRVAASEVLKSSHSAKLVFVEHLEKMMDKIFKRAYNNRQEHEKPRYGQRLDDTTISEIEWARTQLIRDYANAVEGKVNEVVQMVEEVPLDITAREVLKEIQSHLEAATVQRQDPIEYTDMLKEVIDRAQVIYQRKDTQRVISDKRLNGLNEFPTRVGQLKQLQDLLMKQRNEKVNAGKEADPRKKRQFEAEARLSADKYKEALRELSEKKFIEREKMEAHLKTLETLENQNQEYQVREHENTKSKEEYRKRVDHALEGLRRGRH